MRESGSRGRTDGSHSANFWKPSLYFHIGEVSDSVLLLKKTVSPQKMLVLSLKSGARKFVLLNPSDVQTTPMDVLW